MRLPLAPLTAALLCAGLSTVHAQEAAPSALGNLLSKMTENGKRRFVWDEQVTRQFESSRVQSTAAGAESDGTFAFGLEVLAAAGLAVVQIESAGSGTYRVARIQEARGLVQRTCDRVEALPAANEYCRLQVRLRHARAREVHSAIQGLMGDARGFTFVEEGDLLVLTDFAQTLRRVAAFLQEVDVPAAESAGWRVTVEVFETTEDGTLAVADGVPLEKIEAAAGRKGFRRLTRGMAALTTGGGARGGSVRAGTRLDEALEVTILAARGGSAVLQVEQMEVREIVEGEKAPRGHLQVRLALVPGEWAVAGTMPGGKAGATRVVVVRADRDE